MSNDGVASCADVGVRAAVARRLRHLGARLVAAAIVVVLVGTARRARAAELVVSGPGACPDTTELIFRVERAIGTPIRQALPLRFAVRFEAAGATYAARLVVEARESTPRSERTLAARGCSELADAVAVAIALALGSSEPPPAQQAVPAAAEPTPAASPAPAASGAPVSPTPEPADTKASDAAAREGPGLTPALLVSLVGDAGSLPGVGLGFGLGVELRSARFAMRLAGTRLFDRHVAVAGGGATAPGADMSSTLGSLVACTSPIAGAVAEALVCGGWELGRLEAIGTGVEQPRRGAAWWSGPRVDAGVAFAMVSSPLRFFGQLTAVAPLQRNDFYLRELGSVYRPPAVVGRLAIGIDVRF